MSGSCEGPGGVGSISRREHEVGGPGPWAAAGGGVTARPEGRPAGSRGLRSGGGEFAFVLRLVAGCGRVLVQGEPVTVLC